MSRLRRIAALPRQVAGALRRNGMRNVVRFGARLVARHGLVDTLRYAIAPGELRRARLAALQQAAGDEAETANAPVKAVSSAWSVPSAEWARYVAARTPALVAAPGAPRVHVLVGGQDPPDDARDEDWAVLLQPGDAPSDALPAAVAAAGAPGCVQVVTFDMAFDAGEGRTVPVLQPGANPWLARWADVGFGRYGFRVGVLRETRGDGYARLSQWMERLTLDAARDRWTHVAQPLAHVDLTLERVEAVRAQARERALAALEPGAHGERVSAVICTHNRGRLVRQLVRALDDPRIADVVVVANNTTNPAALETLEWVRGRPRCQVLVRDGPFNFSRMSNAGVAVTRGDRLLFLNDDIVPISDDWLEPLLQPLRDPDVGIAGALLLYPDESVQHAGMYLGHGGHAGHNQRHARFPEGDYLFYGSIPRQISAVTGAVMMVRRDLFEAMNGFDELLPTFLQDVDLCLRAGAVGLATIWTPLSELLHMESASIRELLDPAFQRRRGAERARFLARWGALVARDPFHNPAFDVTDEGQRTLARA